jgi:GH25 family lysozyme M1 (1,4-beta-N-acetylmuramidase)
MLGIELTKWNGKWDAARAKSAGAIFAFIQASRATTPDPLFSANWSKAKDANLFRGAYHRLDKATPAQDQVDCFLGLLYDDQGELPIAVQIEAKDFELTDGHAFGCLKEFIEKVNAQGITPMIATSAESWLDPEGNFLDWTRYPLWVADPASQASPQIPAPWTQWTFWKFSEKGDGETFGTESYDIHLNTFHGTLNALLDLTKGATAQKLEERVHNLEQRIHDIDQFVSLLQEPITDPIAETIERKDGRRTPEIYAVCNANSLNVRTGPGLSHQVVGTLIYNQRVRVLEQREDWALIQEPQGWICEKYIAIE